MFLWNNIFFSLGFDVKDHYKDFGGDAAAYVAPVSPVYACFSWHQREQRGPWIFLVQASHASCKISAEVSCVLPIA